MVLCLRWEMAPEGLYHQCALFVQKGEGGVSWSPHTGFVISNK